MQPEILLLDEPTAGLDHEGTEDLLGVLEGLERNGTTLVFSTHDVELAYRFADEVAVFEGDDSGAGTDHDHAGRCQPGETGQARYAISAKAGPEGA